MRILMIFSVFTGLALGLAAPAAAQQQDQTPAPFCQTDARFNQWDFWVGEWNVYSNDAQGNFLGTNSITKHYNGCLIKESWQSANGSGGFSINYFNPVSGKWRQVWVADGYSIDYTGGLTDGGALVLEGHIFSYRRNAKTPFRGIWTPQLNGDVVQHFDIQNPEGEWTTWFEGRYVRKEKDETMEE